MLNLTRLVFYMRPAVANYCVKTVYNGNKFLISRKLFENDQCTQNKNTTTELDSKCVSNLTIYHELLDVNNDGVVSVEDLKELTERFSKLNDMTDEQTFMFSRIIENLWYKHWGCIDPFDYVTVEKYLKYIQYVKENDGLKDEVVQLLPYLFKTVDKDQNGDISKDEYIKFLECIGTSKKTNLIKSLGIINDTDDTIKLEGLMSIIKKHLFHSKNKTEDTTINKGTISYQYN
ncbi:sarcoplasmic calcium-binding protein [Metopolophium dirhodum]|uniref:sarcoplasmic calcium-binding protein n=1 Tax=Metopolophium dirhodum TaxID=44670 RepID=UPI00298F9423|nr:sarcoplasmic calcium-binding protein [Metopolophium dirhodum]